MRRLVLGVLLLSGCSSWRAVERGEWRRVYASDESRRTPEARQDVITRDAYEEEVVAGVRRAWESGPGVEPPFLHQTDVIGLRVGEVMEFRIEEGEPVELLLGGVGVEVFWSPTRSKDEWKVDEGVTKKQSLLLVRGAKPGKATLRLTNADGTKDVPVTVK